MRKLLALITLSCAMAIGAGVSVTSANAATLTSAVHSLKAEQTSFVDKAYYRRYYHRRYYRRGFYGRRYYGGYYRRGYYGLLFTAIITAVAGTKTSAVDHKTAPGLQPRRFVTNAHIPRIS